MRISFVTFHSDQPAPTISKAGDVLTIDGDTLDLSVVAEGSTVRDAWQVHMALRGSIERIDGRLHLTVALPYAAPRSHAEAPAPLVDPADGPLVLPEPLIQEIG